MNSRHRKLGLWLGFPECCVDAFELGSVMIGGLLSGTGFVPCRWCNENKTSDELIREIQENRLCPVPFPDADHRTFRKYFY